MIVEYHRPDTLDAALALLERKSPPTYPLGGGTVLSRHAPEGSAVVDLQNLGMDTIERQGNRLVIGATATLQALADAEDAAQALRDAARQEVSKNLRQTATVAGTLVAGNGASPLLAALLALDATLRWLPGDREITLGNWLPLRGVDRHGLIAEIVVPTHAELSVASVGRSPADRPQVLVAVARWDSGRTRAVVGGKIEVPLLAMDGTEIEGYNEAIKNAYSHYSNPEISKEYLQETATTLVERMIG